MEHMTNSRLIELLQTLPPNELVEVLVNVGNSDYNQMRVVQGAESLGGTTYLTFRNELDEPATREIRAQII